MKTKLNALSVAIVIVVLTAVSLNAQTATVYTANPPEEDETLGVYANAGISVDNPAIASLKEGDRVTGTGSFNGNFIQVQLPNGTVGWVIGRYMIEESAPQELVSTLTAVPTQEVQVSVETSQQGDLGGIDNFVDFTNAPRIQSLSDVIVEWNETVSHAWMKTNGLVASEVVYSDTGIHGRDEPYVYDDVITQYADDLYVIIFGYNVSCKWPDGTLVTGQTYVEADFTYRGFIGTYLAREHMVCHITDGGTIILRGIEDAKSETCARAQQQTTYGPTSLQRISVPTGWDQCSEVDQVAGLVYDQSRLEAAALRAEEQSATEPVQPTVIPQETESTPAAQDVSAAATSNSVSVHLGNCQVTSTNAVLRSQPSRSSAKLGSLTLGSVATVFGQSTQDDGIWWMVAEDGSKWVRSDVVSTLRGCEPTEVDIDLNVKSSITAVPSDSSQTSTDPVYGANREATGVGVTKPFSAGVNISGTDIVLSDGRVFHNCYFEPAPTGGNVTTGVIDYWLEERPASPCA